MSQPDIGSIEEKKIGIVVVCVCVCVGGGSLETECAMKQIETIKPQQIEYYELRHYLNCAKQSNRSIHNYYECNQLHIFLHETHYSIVQFQSLLVQVFTGIGSSLTT